MRTTFLLLMCLVVLAVALPPAQAQRGLRWGVNVPDTSYEYPCRGVCAHTNHLILFGSIRGLGPAGGMTPAQMWSFYGVGQDAGTGSNTIAIVDAFHYPTALQDFNTFSSTFNLPVEASSNPNNATNQVLQVIYASGKQPVVDAGWSQEAALDIEWAHAIAPTAKIILVEAASNSYVDLFAAVDVAVRTPGVREVSMSWSGSEFSLENTYDFHFTGRSAVCFAASGDAGGQTQYPAASPYVVAVGGTSVATDNAGALLSETGWSGSGGGVSKYERKPAYQTSVFVIPSNRRGIPDVSADADPNTGVAVYDSTPYGGLSGWMVFGGTSVSCPCLAAMANRAGHFYAGGLAQLTAMYKKLGTSSFRDITVGRAATFRCTTGWDFITGVGSPVGPGGL